ncbi:glucokinase [Pseudoroseicyclus aestuarii]|uniref:Glucokinase n=1 Tax=Pseudoroseicyclus aestuarii TaxID=1795041 RepID=A0A318T092_9RHOB|nr:glucokinase [Pseudoroseicyclus aestuarii]PYE86136.1 glucokinase [Pseudoroseicyclus aestuarii]
MTKHPANLYSIVADVGGTNTRVALYHGLDPVPETTRRYANAEFPGLESVLRRYIADEGDVDCLAACVAVAGPVRDEKASLTNLDWTIDKPMLARATQAETVAILNDLQAQGHALGHVAEDNLREILPSPSKNPHAAKMVIGIGTGFNAAPVFETEVGRLVTPSESGHQNLPVRSDADMRLANYVATAHGFPAVEDVLSGRGLEHVYAWLGVEAGDPVEKSAHQVMTAFQEGSDDRATEAVRVFARFLGTVAGNLALINLPFGGVYLAGGMAQAMAPYLAQYGFIDAFRDKGRFAGFMSNFGVSVIEDDYAALIGSAAHLKALRTTTLGAEGGARPGI